MTEIHKGIISIPIRILLLPALEGSDISDMYIYIFTYLYLVEYHTYGKFPDISDYVNVMRGKRRGVAYISQVEYALSSVCLWL